MSPTLSVSVDRIEQDLFDLAKFGFNENDKGVYRQGFSDADMQARRWVMQRFEEEGLSARMDGAGNVIGRWGDSDAPAVLIGSHLDSVPAGGIFDGTLGVMAGLECVRVIRDAGVDLAHPIEVIGTAEEEGRFGGMLGAQALTGQVTVDWLEKACDESSGLMLKDAMAAQGLDYRKVVQAARDRRNIKAFLELHIEQGPVLEAEGKSIGVVEGISGVFKWMVHLIGKADHAGTAPMNMRSDAFTGLAEFANEIPRIIDEEGTDKSRITVGYAALKPGYPHTVPGEVEFTIVGRDLDPDVLSRLSQACRRVLSAIARRKGLMFEYDQMSWLEPKACAAPVIDIMKQAAEARGYDTMLMPSGAGHDTQFFTDITDAGLIFIPSIGGVSHAPDELSHWYDIERGANVLLDSVVKLAKG